MATAASTTGLIPSRPRRADALRNYEKLISSAREAFTEQGTSASLEEIARRAGVGIGTLYRNFPTRQALLEAVYVEEVQSLAASAADLAGLPPWDALVGWLRRFVDYMATKQALAQELLSYADQDTTMFQTCRSELFAAGEPLLKRAQDAGAVRADTNLVEVIQMVGGIAKIAAPPQEISHILDVALDGLRFQAPTSQA